MNQFTVSRSDTVEAVPAKQANRLLDTLDTTTSMISRQEARIAEAITRLVGPAGPTAIAAVSVPRGGSPGTLNLIDDKLSELRAEADALERLADRLEAIV